MKVIEECRRVGAVEYRRPGELALPELEVAYLLSCANRVRCDRFDEDAGQWIREGGRGRLRRHVMIIGEPDTAKSSVAEVFLRDLCGAVLREQRNGRDDPRPTYKLLVDGVTPEALRGGVEEYKFVTPEMHNSTFLFAPEFFSFFGHTPNEMMRKVDAFNVWLEEGHVIVNQKKSHGTSRKERERFAAIAEEEGFSFDPESCVISYPAKFSLISCTRQLTEKQYTALEGSGFLGRHALSEWDPDDAELLGYYDDQFGSAPHADYETIRRYNEMAWNMTIEHLPPPPKEMVDGLVRRANRRHWAVSRRVGRSFRRVRPKRERQTLEQLIIAFAIERHLAEPWNQGETHPFIEELSYSVMDMGRAYDYYSRSLDMVEARAETMGTDDQTLFESIVALTALVKKKALEAKVVLTRDLKLEGTDAYETVTQKELVEAIMAHRRVGRGGAYPCVHKLKGAGYITTISQEGRTVLFRVEDHVIEDAGFLPSKDLMFNIRQDTAYLHDYDEMVELSGSDKKGNCIVSHDAPAWGVTA